jgi:hypothetical protein
MGGSAVLNGDVLVDSLVADVDDLRDDLHRQFGVRPYRVFVVKRAYQGEMIGDGAFSDVAVEITPQPRVWQWDGYRWALAAHGLDEKGEIKITEVSLTYTHDELTGGALAPNEQWLIRVGEAHGQGNPDRYFVLSRPPFVDREKDMGWVLYAKGAAVPGCGP